MNKAIYIITEAPELAILGLASAILLIPFIALVFIPNKRENITPKYWCPKIFK